MPTYDYECTVCHHAFEKFQAMSAAPLETCPSCQGRLRRLIGGGTGIIFKGSGFYINDSRKGGNTSSEKKKISSSKEGSTKRTTPSSETKTPSVPSGTSEGRGKKLAS